MKTGEDHKDVILIKPWEEKCILGLKVIAVPAIEGTQGLPQVGYVLISG